MFIADIYGNFLIGSYFFFQNSFTKYLLPIIDHIEIRTVFLCFDSTRAPTFWPGSTTDSIGLESRTHWLEGIIALIFKRPTESALNQINPGPVYKLCPVTFFLRLINLSRPAFIALSRFFRLMLLKLNKFFFFCVCSMLLIFISSCSTGSFFPCLIPLHITHMSRNKAEVNVSFILAA